MRFQAKKVPKLMAPGEFPQWPGLLSCIHRKGLGEKHRGYRSNKTERQGRRKHGEVAL